MKTVIILPMKIEKSLGTLRLIIIFAILLSTAMTFPNSVQAQSQEKELFLVAQKAFEDGFYDVAIRYINQLLEEYPQTEKRTQANLLLGQCHFFKSQYLKAYDVFNALLEHPEYKDATLFWLGETYYKGSDYKQAEEKYKQLIKVYPNSDYTPQAYYSLGWVYFEQGQFEKAQAVFHRLMTTAPDHQLAEDAAFKLGETEYNLRKYENTIRYFKEFVLQYPKSHRHAEAYFYIAESHYYNKDYPSAITYYAQSADISFDNKLTLMAKVSLGWSYLKLNRYKQAQEKFDDALKFSQEKGILSDDVFLGQANLYSDMKEHDKALKAYVQLIETFPKSRRIAEAYLGKANSYYMLKKYTKAILAYQTIIDRYAEIVESKDIIEKAYFGLAWSYLKSGNIDYCIKSFETIKDQTKSKIVKVSALTQIGDAYQDVGQYKEAIDIYDSLIEEYPDSLYTDYVQYRQGVALLKMDNIEAATLSFQSLQSNFPESKFLNDTKYYLAVAYFKREDWMTAKIQIKEFTENLSEDSELLEEAHYILGLSHYGLKEYDHAIKVFQRILKNYPHNSALVRNAEIHIAKSFYKKGERKEALKKFKFLLNKYPQTEAAQESLIWLGDHYLETSDYDKAIVYYQQFVSHFPGSDKLGSIYFELGQAYESRGDYDRAVDAFKKIDAKKDRELSAKAKLAIADIFSRNLDTDESIETYKNIISTSPEYQRNAYKKMAETYKGVKEYSKSLDAYKKGLQANKGLSQISNAELQFHVGDTLEMMNSPALAVEEYFKIPYLYAQETSWIIKAYLRIARIFEDEEKWEEAKTIYHKIIEYKTDEMKFAQERLEWIKQNTINLN